MVAQIYKLWLKQHLWQSAILLLLHLQLYEIISIFKIHQAKQNIRALPYLSRKRNIVLKKTKYQTYVKKRSLWVRFTERTGTWWQKMLGPDVTDNCWRKNFRMNKEDFFELAGLLKPIIRPKWISPNYRQLTTEKKLAITLHYLKDTGSLWMTANTFRVHQRTVSKILFEVCKAINEILGPKYLYLPRNTEKMREILQALGCIDGTRVPLKRPLINSQEFFNYKEVFFIKCSGSVW